MNSRRYPYVARYTQIPATAWTRMSRQGMAFVLGGHAASRQPLANR